MIAGIIAFLLMNPLVGGIVTGLIGAATFGLLLGWLQVTIVQLGLFFAGLFIIAKVLTNEKINIERAAFISLIGGAMIYFGVSKLLFAAIGVTANLSVVP